jgi:hypothetical protein
MSELADAPRRQCTRLIRLLYGLHLVEIGSGIRRLGSGFDNGDERIPKGFEEDEQVF